MQYRKKLGLVQKGVRKGEEEQHGGGNERAVVELIEENLNHRNMMKTVNRISVSAFAASHSHAVETSRASIYYAESWGTHPYTQFAPCGKHEGL